MSDIFCIGSAKPNTEQPIVMCLEGYGKRTRDVMSFFWGAGCL